LRVGLSAYHGPYLDRQYAYFFPGEANPNTLPATGLGLDAYWARHHWTVQGELQKFVMPYKAIPTYRKQAGYAELKRVLGPRWYFAGRIGYTSANEGGSVQSFEGAGGFRPNRFQLIKFDYELQHYSMGTYINENTMAIQYVTSFHKSVAGN
jgi:hypothetical protein